jgi:hypothetical protein
MKTNAIRNAVTKMKTAAAFPCANSNWLILTLLNTNVLRDSNCSLLSTQNRS